MTELNIKYASKDCRNATTPHTKGRENSSVFSLPLTSCLSAPKLLPRPLELWCSARPADDDNSAAVHTHTHTPNLTTHSSVELFGLGERVRAACELVNLAPAPSTDIKMYNIRPAERKGGAFNALLNSLFFWGLFIPCGFYLSVLWIVHESVGTLL